jgi:hypothetical protein
MNAMDRSPFPLPVFIACMRKHVLFLHRPQLLTLV